MFNRKLAYFVLPSILTCICLVLIFVVWVLSNFSMFDGSAVVLSKRTAKPESDQVREVWVKPDVFASYNFGNSLMVSTQGIVAIEGFIRQAQFNNIHAISGSNGKELWSKDPGLASAIDSDSSGLYIGARDGSVKKRAPKTGEIIWENRASGTGGVLSLHVSENNVYVLSQPNSFDIFEANSGEKINLQIPGGISRRDIYLISNDVIYSGALNAINVKTGQPLWEQAINEVFYEVPIFTEDRIYIRTGKSLGRVYAIDRSTGNFLWTSDRDTVSNIIVVKDTLYLLTERAAVQSIDGMTGMRKTLVTFEPNSFRLAGDSTAVSSGYYIAFDEETSFLFTLLGDSNQLFAFELTH